MAKTSVPLYQTINNLRFATNFKRENVEFAINHSPKNTDKIVVTGNLS
jgi:hypothetical protein